MNFLYTEEKNVYDQEAVGTKSLELDKILADIKHIRSFEEFDAGFRC